MNKSIGAKLIHVKGLVQGVGFRPFIYRLAHEQQLHGWVENRNDGVVIKIEGANSNIDQFVESIRHKAPAASNIFSIKIINTELKNHTSFQIIKSKNTSDEITDICPDIAVCEACLKDMKEQKHRIDYPFINCTNCGPRFTIIKDLPYDRDKTTMDPFRMCNTCQSEYNDILDRRFHAQPIACNSCGPEYELIHGDRNIRNLNEIIDITCDLLEEGKIIAIKGMGGFHLACDAQNEDTVKRLRISKNRDGKPFAVMFPDINTLKQFIVTNQNEEKSLISWKRPILILKNKPEGPKLANDVSVGFNTTGAMLPYMPIHYMLFSKLNLPVIVLTSGNISDEPIIIDNQEAIDRLSNITDAILIHNRDIYNRTDDSVELAINNKERMIRRSRGFVPDPIYLNLEVDGIFAAGAELVNCFCIGKKNQAIMSQHIGDLKNLETLDFYSESIERFKKLYRVRPWIFAHDLHPDYLSTLYAKSQTGLKISIQHHHAHIASCMAEHGLDEKIIGISFDGVGYGIDDHIWGGEFFVCDLTNFERYTHFEYVPMPGGDKATKEPWRMAVSYLYKTFGKDFLNMDIPSLTQIDNTDIETVMRALELKINTPLTSSAGRLFDAVSALTGLCNHSNFHAEAPMRLESVIDSTVDKLYAYDINETISFDKTIIQIVQDLGKGIYPSIISAKFHNTIINIIFAIANKIRKDTGLNKVVLSGGTFQNRYILGTSENLLKKNGFNVFTQSRIPSNDGGIALGQLAITAKRKSLGLI